MTTEHLAHDLLLLMLNLAQLSDPVRTLRLFVESLNDLVPTVAVHLLDEDEADDEVEDEAGQTFAIKTSRNDFGSISVQTSSGNLPQEYLAMIRNSVGVLAIVLENQQRTRMLNDQNTMLDAAVRARTQELEAANAELRTEIAQRKFAETELRESAARLERVVKEMPVLLDAFDEADTLIAWNRECERVTGYSAGEIIGNPEAMAYLYPDPAYRAQLLEDPELRSADFRDREMTLTCKNGETRTISWSSVSQRAPVPGWHRWSVGVDVTARIKAQQALQAGNRSLQAVVAELKATHDEMIAQERLAAVGQMAAGIAHDFNNYLASIVLYSQLAMLDPGQSAINRRRMRSVYDQAQQAATLVQKILDFSGQGMLRREFLDLGELITTQITELGGDLPDHTRVVAQVDGASYPIRADRARLEQVLANLIENATDAMPDGGEITLALSAFTLAERDSPPCCNMAPGEWTRLTVSDVGKGIAPDDLPHVFEPFFTTQSPEHSGLGLPQVHGIVAQHGGHVTVDSLPGHGTTVTVYLPTAEPRPSADARREAATKPWPQGQNERILLVESNPTVAAAIAEALHSLDYRTTQADNGAAALQRLADATSQIDLVLSDVALSESAGIELFHLIHRKHPTLPVIFISGRPDTRQIEALKAAGLAAWLDKPPRLEQLAVALRVALNNRS